MIPYDARSAFRMLAPRFELGATQAIGVVDSMISAIDRETGAAVSILRRQGVDLDGFHRDLQAARRIDSPHLPRILETLTVPAPRTSVFELRGTRGRDTDDGFVVLERCTGPTLGERCANAPIALADAAPMLTELAGALRATAAANPGPRDLTLHNALWSERGDHRAVLSLDFGLAAETGPNSTLRQPRLFMRLPYLSREALMSEPHTERADVYAFGVCCYRMLVGDFPIARRNLDEPSYLQHILATAFDPAQLPETLPSPVRSLIAWTLEVDPAQRPSVGELVELADRTFVA